MAGRRPWLKAGDMRPRAQGLYAAWSGYGPVEDWGAEPRPDPGDPVWLYYWRRHGERQCRAFRRAQVREARRRQAWQAFAADLAARCQTASLQPALPALAARSTSSVFVENRCTCGYSWTDPSRGHIHLPSS